MDQDKVNHEMPIMILSIMAILAAAALSIASIVTKSNSELSVNASDPFELADQAANAGIDAAKWHIECHGRTEHGGISSHYFVNGAVYSVEWDDVNLQDSTVRVRSSGQFPGNDGQQFAVNLERKIKISFLPAHTNDILSDYYSRPKKPLYVSQ